MRKIVLISCVSKKLVHAAKVRDIYVSPLFRLNLAYAESLKPDAIYVLSAKHGLLPLDDFPDRWGAREMIAAAEAALGGQDDLRHRAELLGTAVRRRTLEAAFAGLPERTPEVVDA